MKMGLVVLVRNLLLTLCLCLVLGFMYYAAWKLHLLRWEDPNSGALTFDSVGRTLGSGRRQRNNVALDFPSLPPSCLAVDSGQSRTQKAMMEARGPAQPKYDRLGFLLKLDSKLPAELATKYANLSDGACKPGYASALMTAIFPKFSRPAPMFLDDSFRKWARIRDFVPPFGIKGQDNLIKAILSATKEYRLTPALDSLSCRRCIIIGNGGVLANKSLGARIDDYDIVVRLNSAPVKGFEKDVGGKTTLRITYPEGAMQRPEEYEKDSLFVLAGFKWQDFKWLKYIVYKEKVVSGLQAPSKGPSARDGLMHWASGGPGAVWAVPTRKWPELSTPVLSESGGQPDPGVRALLGGQRSNSSCPKGYGEGHSCGDSSQGSVAGKLLAIPSSQRAWKVGAIPFYR
ncbi:CMP-N-acetylneuraminate-beta-1,4-galactoside alpha-2,3-sialyltransferase isoform X2 [Sarcophilus harrisii]|uniref:CMP-N-acetylneuraminate-beta-1,4-galactoside alpha-2,3-sialyltransferase isoform X2 n=1 Tax=Sarcophilus harrisii TaxID=9305 RepID=UPI001301D326|nr:CMP-N-acetylneuraminate-beta-1,4-galactoside alpha-2,3-sialyltransferase isoform X2 [Sarcophilus harrisii]